MSDSPAVLLKNLLRVTFNLYGAISIFEKPDLRKRLEKVNRRLFVSHVLSRGWTMVIAGAQGAGKTTLVRLLYELDDGPQWLPANAGRGERLPVLLQEDENVVEPLGYILRQIDTADGFTEETVSPAEFQHAARGELDHCLIPILRLPRRYLAQPSASLLLLPGYEEMNEKNAEWQTLMRQAVLGASACLLVTDASRMAKAAPEMLADLRHMTLAGATPVVAVTKTENSAESARQELRDTAATRFNVPVEGVICTGTLAETVETARSAFAQALAEAGSGAAPGSRHLEPLLEELSVVLVDVGDAFAMEHVETAASPGKTMTQDYLAAFDDAVDRLKQRYEKALDRDLNQHLSSAAKIITPVLVDKHEGLWNKIKALPQTSSELRQQMEQDIEAAWLQPGPIAALHASVLGEVTADALGGPKQMPIAMETQPLSVRLSYIDATGKEVSWIKVTDKTVQDLTYLFGEPGSQDDFTHKLTTEVSRSVQLLPALALEFCRVGQLMPEAVGITPAPHEPRNPLHGLHQTGDYIQQLSGIKNNIAKAVGIMLVVDGAAAIATAASAFLGVGVIAVGGHVALRAHDSGTYNRAVNTLAGIKDAHATHYKAYFKEIMDKARDSLRLHLEAGFRLDERVMRLDRVARALAQAQSLRDDIAGAASPIALFYDA